jgi:hypothetical protein
MSKAPRLPTWLSDYFFLPNRRCRVKIIFIIVSFNQHSYFGEFDSSWLCVHASRPCGECNEITRERSRKKACPPPVLLVRARRQEAGPLHDPAPAPAARESGTCVFVRLAPNARFMTRASRPCRPGQARPYVTNGLRPRTGEAPCHENETEHYRQRKKFLTLISKRYKNGLS